MGKVEFTAYLAGVNSAAKPFSIDREGNGKLVLEFSASDCEKVLALRQLADSALHVSITAE